jgi:hypothetical protein
MFGIEKVFFEDFGFLLALFFDGRWMGGKRGLPQGFQNNFKGNYAENFIVQKVNALKCSLCLVISLV